MITPPLLTQAQDFLKNAFAELERKNFTLEDRWHVDHLCYRTSTQENYLSAKTQFQKFSRLLIESEVNGRLISTFKLETPLVFQGWQIDLIEVPAPKKGKMTEEGFEHLEIVCDLSFEEIKSFYPQGQFNEAGLSKDFNRELEVIFDGFAVKFHHLSLESVINLEGNTSVFSALKNSDVLNLLKPFSPLVAGTFPLNLSMPDSDLDILISGDLNLVKQILQTKFSSFSEFKCHDLMVKGEPTVLASFLDQGVRFEIFGQKVPSIQQQAYLHFLIEERLLKIGGDYFAEKIRRARARGLKTEPAFAEVLGLDGDAFEELLSLQRQNNSALKALLT